VNYVNQTVLIKKNDKSMNEKVLMSAHRCLMFQFKHLFMAVKITVLLLFTCVFCLQAENPNSLNVLLTINQTNSQLEQVLDDIEKQSDFLFIYNNQVNMSQNVSLNVHKVSLNDVLKQLFGETDIRFEIEGSYVILSIREKNETGLPVVNQQTLTITGRVVDERGEGMPSVNVVIKGTATGVITDIDGKYSISVPDNNTILVFSFLGYLPVERSVGNQRTINVSLAENAQLIDEVVVTALGIIKKEKSLTYSTQIVEGNELTRAKDPNMINSLAGKTAGVQINKSSSGLGGSVKVVIRGNRSVTGSNQPLYVIDGVPINTSVDDQSFTTIGGTHGGNRDGGDGISNLNPDDIESMNILKGPAAAALYGSSAANGVVVITTKKGKAGKVDIVFNTNTTWDQVAYGIPELQNHYGGTTTSWGEKISPVNLDYLKDFFSTGMTTINSLSFSAGSDLMQTYFSYANTYGEGLIDNNDLSKHNFNIRETAAFFDKKLTLDVNLNLLYQKAKNRPISGGYYLNPLIGLYHFPIGGPTGGESFEYYRDNYSILNPARNLYVQNWYPGGITTMEQSPYWLVRKQESVDVRARTIANLSLSYKINNNLTLQARGNADFISDKYDKKMYAGGHSTFTGLNGAYLVMEGTDLSLYADILLTYQRQISDFMLNTTLGGSVSDYNVNKSTVNAGGSDGMYYPNIFTMGNMNLAVGTARQEIIRRLSQSAFFAGQLSFRDWLFLDITARNDWTSTLAFTESKWSGFFYPSVGLTWVLNESLQLPAWVTLGKLRGAWSQVGNGLPEYISNPLNTLGSGGNLVFNTKAPFTELKPEKTTSIEVGTEWRLFGSRIEFDFTYYETNTRNQLFTLAAPAGSKYSEYYVNAGNIRNRGIEIILGGSPVLTEDFRWKTSVNYSTNKNKVLELAEGLGYFSFGQLTSNSYLMRLEVGGSFGDFYGYKFLRDESGNISYNNEGLPIGDKSTFQKIGNTAPKFNLGWQNTFTYKDFSLYFLFDGRFGGDVLSLTLADLDRQGVTKATGIDRDNGYVSFDGKQIKNVEGFYSLVGGRDGITEYYVYDATNIRLRELSIGYTLPQKIFKENAVVKSVDVSLVGRNLFFIANNAPYDPDNILSTGNDLQGVDVFAMPTSRSFGINIKANF
jgi:TonB-linked SusC/RagA family outer membrane protein